MKIYEWENILCPDKLDSFLVFSHNPGFVEGLAQKKCKISTKNIDDSTKKYGYIFFDFDYLLNQDIWSLIDSGFKRTDPWGRLIIYENKEVSLLKKLLIKKRIRKMLSKKVHSQNISFSEIVSIPDLHNPKCVYARDDNVLQPYIFGHFLFSYSFFKRIIYKFFYILAKAKMNFISDNFFASVFVVQKT